MDAALEIIRRDGYEKISIDAIAREAGVTRPVVYGAYDGLAPLLIALLDRQQTRAVTQLAAVFPAGLENGDLAQAVEGWMRQVVADPETWWPILAQRHSMPGLVRERVDNTREVICEQLAILVRQRYAHCDAEVAARTLLAVCEQFGQLLLEDPPRFTVERLAKAVRNLCAGWDL